MVKTYWELIEKNAGVVSGTKRYLHLLRGGHAKTLNREINKNLISGMRAKGMADLRRKQFVRGLAASSKINARAAEKVRVKAARGLTAMGITGTSTTLLAHKKRKK